MGQSENGSCWDLHGVVGGDLGGLVGKDGVLFVHVKDLIDGGWGNGGISFPVLLAT